MHSHVYIIYYVLYILYVRMSIDITLSNCLAFAYRYTHTRTHTHTHTHTHIRMYIVITEPLGKLLLRSAPTSALRPSATSACSLQLLVYEEVTSALPHRLLRSFGFLAALARHNFSVTTLSPLAIPPFCIPWKIKKYLFFCRRPP